MQAAAAVEGQPDGGGAHYRATHNTNDGTVVLPSGLPLGGGASPFTNACRVSRQVTCSKMSILDRKLSGSGSRQEEH